MGYPYIGEIRMFGGNFAPDDWEFCAGQLMSIQLYQTLFDLIGTTYGGDGVNNFRLPDLRGRIPVHRGNNFSMGQAGGVEQVSLTVAQTPAHSHPWLASSESSAGQTTPEGSMLARTPGADVYTTDMMPVDLAPEMVDSAGGSQPHDNMQPYLCVNFIICLFGLFPDPN